MSLMMSSQFVRPVKVLTDALDEHDYAMAERMAAAIIELCRSAKVTDKLGRVEPMILCEECWLFLDKDGDALRPQPDRKASRMKTHQIVCNRCKARKESAQSATPPGDRD